MSTVIPNRFGESLERSTQNLMAMMLQTRGLQLEQQRLNLGQRQQTEAERRGALERLISFAPFLPEGRAISELPQIHESLQRVFPEFDPASPQDLGGVVLNERTLDDMLRPMLMAEFEALSPEARSGMLERALNRSVLGAPVSGTELEAQETRSSMFLDAYSNLRQDSVALDGIFRTQMGLQQPIRIQVGGRTLQWDTAQAASLAVQLAMHQDEYGLRLRQIEGSDQQDIVGELMKQMEAAGQPIPRSVGFQIVNAYNRRAQLSNDGLLTSENDPIAPLINSPNPDVSAAAQFFVGAGQIGERTLEDFLRDSGPAGEQVLRGIMVSEALTTAGLPSEIIPDATKSVLEALGGGEPGSPFPGFRNRFWQDRGFQITAPNAQDVQSLNLSPGAPPTPTSNRETITIQAIRDVIGSGQGTREEAISLYGQEIVDRALTAEAGGTWEPAPVEDNSEISNARTLLRAAEQELETYLSPVSGRPEEQRQARLNSATGKRIQAKITRLRRRVEELGGSR